MQDAPPVGGYFLPTRVTQDASGKRWYRRGVRALRVLAGAFVIVVGASHVVAVADALDDAKAAFARGAYAAGVALLQPIAEQGDAAAQGILGYMYSTGSGVPQDNAAAFNWYSLAAAQGDDEAQYNIGVMYAEGKGVDQDDVEAVKWYRLAADQRNVHAQQNLGVAYGTGRGVPKDLVRAYMWFSLAAAQGNERAARNRDTAAGVLTDAQVAEGERLAQEWMPR